MEYAELARGVVRDGEFRSTDDIRAASRRAATVLSERSVGPGDAVAILMRNDFAFLEATLAAALLGASPVPVNWHGTSDEVRHVLAHSRAKALVAHADLLAGLTPETVEDIAVLGVDTPDGIADAYGIDATAASLDDRHERWAQALAAAAEWDAPPEVAASPIYYTSGTTGAPKGLRRIASSVDEGAVEELNREWSRVTGVSPGMRTAVVGPMYHLAPNGYAMRAFHYDGLVVLAPKFDPQDLLRTVEKYRLTHLSMVPTMFARLLKLPEEIRRRYDLSSLTFVVHSAAPCPPQVKIDMIDWWGPIIWENYGATETGVVVACSSEEWLAHPGTVGRTISTATLRILDDDGAEVPEGQQGEVFVKARGTQDFVYDGDEDGRRAVERDGLITAGDIGYVDSDGFLYLCDRKKDMVISGGVNIYPAEIERVLAALPGVKDCAVFGVPDQDFGESLLAAVEPEPGILLEVDDLREQLRARLAGFKVPRRFEFHDALPREDSGKIFKRKLRDEYWSVAGRAI